VPAVGNEAKLILKLAAEQTKVNRETYLGKLVGMGKGLVAQASNMEGYDQAVKDYQDCLTVIVAELQSRSDI